MAPSRTILRLRLLAEILSGLLILFAGCVPTQQPSQQTYVWEMGRICDRKSPPWHMERVEADGRYVIQGPANSSQGRDDYFECMKEQIAKTPYRQWVSQRAGSPQGADVAPAWRNTPRPLPDPARTYDTESAPRVARPNAEASRLERAARAALGARGSGLVADARLDTLAAWADCQPLVGALATTVAMGAAAQRLGLVEPLSTLVCVTAGNDDGAIEGYLRQLLGSVPANVPLSHIGVSARAVPGGFIGGVVVSARELRLAPFPRVVEPGASLELRGDVDARFVKTRLAVTLPSGGGATQESDRRFALELPVPTAGVYGVEILGDGPTGPVVVLNVRVYAGVPEPSQVDEETAPAALSSVPRTAARAEDRLLELVNAARARTGVAPVEADDELARVALGHAQDMSAHNFVGHVSPTTGDVAKRARAAGIDVGKSGENVALSGSADSAHQELMASPAHRAAILDGEFTHVGIGTVTVASPTGEPRLYITQVFARRVVPIDVKTAPVVLLERVNAARSAQTEPALTRDAKLDAVARTSLDAAVGKESAGARTAAALAEARTQLARSIRAEVRQCVLVVHARELEPVARMLWASRPSAVHVGIAAGGIAGSHEVLIVIAVSGRDGVRCD